MRTLLILSLLLSLGHPASAQTDTIDDFAGLQRALVNGSNNDLLLRCPVVIPSGIGRVVIPENRRVRREENGRFFVPSGDTLDLGAPLDVGLGYNLLTGQGRYLLKGRVHTDWFSTGKHGEIDDEWGVVSTDHEPYSHVMRRAIWAASHGGKRAGWIVVVDPGVHVTEDAGRVARIAFGEGRHEYREVIDGIAAYARLYGRPGYANGYEIYSHGEVVLSPGAYLVPPNEGESAAIDYAPYRTGGWDFSLDNLFPYDTAAAAGDTAITLKVTPPPGTLAEGTTLAYFRGSSYGDQYDGGIHGSRGVTGNTVFLSEPLSRDLWPSRSSFYGKLITGFRQPVVGDTVGVTLTKDAPVMDGFPFFSIGNDLYEVVQRLGGRHYRVRNVGRGNSEAGTWVPAATKIFYARVVLPTATTVENFVVSGSEDSYLIGRRDLIRNANTLDCGIRGPTLVHARRRQKGGLWLNGDGYRNFTIRDSYLYSASRWAEVGQPARSGTGLLFDSVRTYGLALDVSEFSAGTTIRDSRLEMDLRDGHRWRDDKLTYLLNVGKTTAATLIENTTLICRNCDYLLRGEDIQEMGASAGGGLTLRGVDFTADSTNIAFSWEVTAAEFKNVHGTGVVSRIFSTVGAPLMDGPADRGMLEDGRVIWSQPVVPHFEDVSFRGDFDHVIGGKFYGATGKIVAYYRNNDILPGDGPRAHGLMVSRSGPDAGYTAPALDLTIENYGYPLLPEVDYIKYRGTVVPGQKILVRLNPARGEAVPRASTGKPLATLCVGDCE